MRRELNLNDTSQSFTFKVSSASHDGQKQRGTNIDQFRMVSIGIETLVRNSQKTDEGIQVDAHRMNHEVKGGSPVKNEKQLNDDDQVEEEEVNQDTLKRLTKFLRKINPLMEKQLTEYFPKYSLYGTTQTTPFFSRQSRHTHTLYHPNPENLVISDISWNATGVLVAASYVDPEHEGSSSRKGMICLWSPYKRNFHPGQPQIIITTNYIGCLKFHPKKPSILACGAYTGQIFLYDLSRTQQQLLAKTTIDEYFHRDMITQLSWWSFNPPNKPETMYNLLSLSTDGKILLWEVPNQSISEDASHQRLKMLLRYPLKGFLMLRKKEGSVLPVSGIAMNQSKINKNVFIVGSEGGSILKAALSPINHFINTEAKALLDIQQGVKFKQTIYPFMLNLPQKVLPDVKNHLEKYCQKYKIKEVESLSVLFNSAPELRSIYPNPIAVAYQPLAFPISSISDNKYGLFVANGYDGYSRIYAENSKINLQSIEEGWEWGWISGGGLLGGFIGQEWVVMDWVGGGVLWSLGVGQGSLWTEHKGQIAIAAEKTKVKLVQLADKLLMETEETRSKIITKIKTLKTQ